MGFWVFYTCESGFWSQEAGWYHSIHDRLGERHGASPNWDRWSSPISRAFPYVLQIFAQFLISHVQLFIVCLRCGQISLEPFLVCSGRRNCLLEGAQRLHELLHGDIVPSFWCN